MTREHWYNIACFAVTILTVAGFYIIATSTIPKAINDTFYAETTVKCEIVEVRYSDKFFNQISGKEYQTVVRYNNDIYTLKGEDYYYAAIEKIGEETEAIILTSETFNNIKFKELIVE